MAYGVLYEFRRTSTNGADILITISQRDYEGEVKKRSLGRVPVIKRDNNGHVYGTSCELYAECLVDGEFSQLYTSDAYEFRVEVYRNDSLLWMGFVSPELYSEPDVAPPYDVQIIATDGLGELKNFKFEKRGVASMLSHINYLMGKTGIGMALNVVSELRYVDDAGVASDDKGILDFKINLDHEEGSTCYDVLQHLLSSINANITQYNGRYLIFRETDFINKATEEGVEGCDINGSAVSWPVASFGSMNEHEWWPVGQLSTVIEPAKNEVVLRAPNYYKDNVLDFDDWALANAASFNEEEGAYILPDEGSNISQYVDFGGVDVGYRLGLRVKARNVGITETDQNIGIRVEINGRAWAESLGTQFWLRKSGGASTGHPLSDYAWNTKEDFVEEELRMPTYADTSADAQNIDIVIPLYDNANDVLGTFVYANDIKITIFNPAGIHDIYVYGVSLVKYEQIEGYEADVVINNAAREEEGEVELTMSAGDLAPAAGKVFMTGIPLLPLGSDPIKQWQVGNGNSQDYLSAMAYDYSRAIALPKMKYAGVLNVPGATVSVPLLFLRDGTYYFPKTYSYDIYNDELEVELISISAADVSLTSVIISQMAQSSGNMGGLTTSGSAGGGVVSLPRDKEMSDTSDNAVENRVIKAYVDGEVKEVADLLTSMWRIEDNKIVTDMDVLIKANLIVEGDTSSGGEGEDTPASGIRGIYVNGTPYTDDDGDGFIDLGTISGGVSEITASMITSALGYTPANGADYLPSSGGRITGNSLDIGREDNYAGAFVKIITNASTSADYGTSIRHYEKSSGSYTYKGLLIDKNGAYYSNNGSNYALIHSGNIGSQKVERARYIETLNYVGNAWYADQYKMFAQWTGDTIVDWMVTDGSYEVRVDRAKKLSHSNGTVGAVVNSSGNVTIGGSDLAGTTYKMSVDGKVHIRSTAGASMNEGAGSLIVGNGAVLMIDANDIQAKTNGTTAGPLYINDWGGNVILCGQNKGNVLIGTTTDSGDKLHVEGRIRMRSVMLSHVSDDFATSGSYLLQYYTPSNKLLALTSRSGSSSAFKNYIFTSDWSNGHIGLCGVPSSDHNVYVTGSLGITGAVTISSSLSVSGNVGIGTSSPAYKLDVAGTGRFKAASDNYTALRLTNAWYGGSGKKNTDIVMESSVDYRGGIIRCTIDAAYGYFESLSFGAGSNGASSYIPYLTISSAGNVTIAKNLIVTGDTSSGSDIRFKDIIKNKTLKIEHIAKAPLFTFKWNDRDDDAVHLGSSAQYWEKVCPWLVTGEDFKSLNYATLGVAMGISLAKKAVNHEARIKELEREIKRLKEEMRYGG